MLVNASFDTICADNDAIIIYTHDICNCPRFNQRFWIEKQVLAHLVDR